MAYDIVIRGGEIVDGSGNEPYRGDVAIQDGVIAAVGTVDRNPRDHGPQHGGPSLGSRPRGPVGGLLCRPGRPRLVALGNGLTLAATAGPHADQLRHRARPVALRAV